MPDGLTVAIAAGTEGDPETGSSCATMGAHRRQRTEHRTENPDRRSDRHGYPALGDDAIGGGP